jgi:CRISPR-associated protein Cas8c/Csp2
MTKTSHPFIKYGIAVTLVNSGLADQSLIEKENLITEITRGVNHFRVKPINDFKEKKSVKFEYTNELKGNTAIGLYLASTILSSDKDATDIPKALNDLRQSLRDSDRKKQEIKRSITPISGEFTSFGSKAIGRGKPKTDLFIAAYCAITTSTPLKPAMTYKTFNKGKFERENVAIIPDLEIVELVDFINLFSKLKDSATEKLMIGNVKDGKPFRPKIFDGNFPFAPKTSALGSIALLGAIGSWAKEAKNIVWAKKVLDSLTSKAIYLIGSKTFETFTYNHFIIEIAKENKLNSIIDSIYYSVLYNQGFRNRDTINEYQKFDLFASRFLKLFNRPSFKDFLSFRAEYPPQLELLFNSYFSNMEKINEKTVRSAHALGKWLNYAAYLVAKSDATEKSNEELKKAKAKALVEIESSIFSARSGDALIFQAITRAGRLSNTDAPSEAELFMTQTATGEITLESAKHLLIAFSRVMNKIERKENPSEIDIISDDVESESNDFSDAQE